MFIPISIDDDMAMHMKSNPETDVEALRAALAGTCAARKEGAKCRCGQPIWFVGSALNVFTKRDAEAEPVAKGGSKQSYEPDSALRNFENVPLSDDIDAYFGREVRPHVPDAWMNRARDKVGYEIDTDLKKAGAEVVRLLQEVTK